MDHRYGAWAQLLTLFRLIYDGGRHGGFNAGPQGLPLRSRPLSVPRRRRPQWLDERQPGERTDAPRVSDGVVFRVLQNLLILDGERLSYRTLDVEQIGSVYETMMGFNLEVAAGPLDRHQARRSRTAHRPRSTWKSCSRPSPPTGRSGSRRRPTRS